MMTLDLIHNLALLVTLSVVHHFMVRRMRQNSTKYQIVSGFLFGGITVVGMLTPVRLMDGIIFDGRSIILSMAGVFGGSVVAAIAAVISGGCRYWLGGDGVWMGLGVIAESSVLGVILYNLRKKHDAIMRIPILWGFGLLVHVIMVMLMFILPGGVGLYVVSRVALPVLVLYPIVSTLGCLIFLDQEERVKTDVVLRESEGRYRSIFHNNHATMLLISPDSGQIIDANPAACRYYGWSHQELTHMNIADINGFPVERIHTEMAAAQAEQRKQFLFQHRRANGAIRDVEVYSGPIQVNGRELLYSIVHDVTDRVLAERALRESEQALNRAQAVAKTGSWRLDIPQNILRWSDESHRIFGIPKGTPISYEKFMNTIHPADREYVDLKWNLAMQGEPYDIEHRILVGNSVRWVRERAELELDNEGNLRGGFGTAQDITERKLSEEILLESEQRFHQLVEQSPISIEIYRPDGILILANKAYEQLWNISRKIVVGKYNIRTSKHSAELKIRPYLEKAFAGDDVIIPELAHNPKGPSFPEARLRYVQPYVYPIKNSSGQVAYVVLINIDVTDKHQIEQQLLQAQKMETIGRLAGGVAHDFNNILTVINANAELALAGITEPDAYHDAFFEIKKAGDKAAGLTRQLLAFSRKQIVAPQVVNLNTTLLEMDKMLRRLIGENIELVTIPDESVNSVFIDPGQIEQVLTNLIVNSKDAMPMGGRLTIETQNTVLDEDYCASHPEMIPGNYVMMSVTDTGKGMDAETASHAFEPFFTTKPKGGGTGLGLSTCYGIVKQNRGGIWIYSEVDHGTSVKVYLPAYSEKATLRSLKESGAIPPGSERIMVVEDDPHIRSITARLLSKLGYQVSLASNGEDALAQPRDVYEGINLLITDVIMPLMGGRELAERIKQHNPAIKVLFMSGYTDNSIVHHGVLEPGIHFIQKPFSMDDFARKVRAVLDS